MNDPLIRLEGAHIAYSTDRPVLRGVDLALRPAERIGLVGPNGCGKTTLLHLLVGLLKPTSGRVVAFGKVRHDEAGFYEVRARVGLVFQDPEDQLFCPTVLEDVVFGPLNLGKTAEEARAVACHSLDLLGLAGFEDRITYKLSAGEKRLVSLATVLAMRPDALLLDEPTGGLDDVSKARIGAVLGELGQAMILVSHERDFLSGLVSRIVRLENGHLTESTA